MKNLTCPILVQSGQSWGALEWHWPTDSKYINFLAVGALGAEISSPEFPNFGRNSKMAAGMGAATMTKQKKKKKKFFFFFFFKFILEGTFPF